MSQQQQPRRRPEPAEQEPIRYGDVFPSVAGSDLASKPIAPQDAAAMQAAEARVMGRIQKGGPAAVMSSAAAKNEEADVLSYKEATSAATNEGMRVTREDDGDTRVVTESVGGQVVGRYVEPAPVKMKSPMSALEPGAVTIGEALESAALTAGDKPVDQRDAAAIQAAEIRATGAGAIAPGGVAATAQSAASINERTMATKATLSDVLANATARLPADKPATREDAEGVIAAELRNDPAMKTHPGGVAASVAAAARYNQG